MKISLKILLKIFFLFSITSILQAQTYYVSGTGDDSNSGMSPNDAWQTISKVNSYQLNPGDSILFSRGDYWRGQLIPQSGNSVGYILYGAYGVSDNPLFLGSVKKNSQEDWLDAGNNIWSSGEPTVIGNEVIYNPSFDVNSDGWFLYSEGGAVVSGVRDELEFDTSPASFRIDCISNGSEAHHIQFFTSQEMSINEEKIYKLSFRAKCTKSFEINSIPLMKMTSPWHDYYNNSIEPVIIGTDWTSCVIYYQTNITTDDARITFALGGVLPEGESFYIDDISLKECENADFINDVGNIIFNSEESCGIKVWNSDDLDAQGKFLYNYNNFTLDVYSITNPALYYQDIECALTTHIIDESNKSYVIFENLELKYGGAHGIGGGNTHHIIVRDCDLSYIGGGELKIEGYNNVRYGNGIEFWGNAYNNLVERCRLWEIYDAALTNQNNMENVNQYNIIYRNNIIWNCEYSYEFWNHDENSFMYDIFFVNNTCVDAGNGWGHSQRPDPSGLHVVNYANVTYTGEIRIINNIFYESSDNCIYIHSIYGGLENLNLDYNCWYQTSGGMINFQGNEYTMSQFSVYQSETSQDQNSITEDPLFVNLSEDDFHLTENSPCIDAGDPNSPLDPDGTIADIGAYYFDQLGTNSDDSYTPLLERFFLFQNYPNPFNPVTTISFNLPRTTFVTIPIYDINGCLIATLISQRMPAGMHKIQWYADDLSSGVYLYKIKAGQYSNIKKCVLLK